MSALLAVMAAAGSTAAKLYADDVFSAFTYTGNSGTQNIVNGIDLAGKGGMVWLKSKATNDNHYLYDSARGATKPISTNSTGAQTNNSPYGITQNSNGFNISDPGAFGTNDSGFGYASWTFRKAPKFFDIVTWTGTGANRTIAHNLSAVPGMIWVKRTDTTGDWQVYHNGIANTEFLLLNTTAAKATGATKWNSTTPTASDFSLGTHVDVNASGGTYVAYIFAHDTGASGLIQCGTFTADGSGNATVSLGWEPQFVLTKRINSAGQDWHVIDSTRGWTMGNSSYLAPNTSSAESSGNVGNPTAAGFYATGFAGAGDTYVYMAIRRPNKPPTSGTQVYNAVARTGTGAAATVTGVGFAPDLAWGGTRTPLAWGNGIIDRLRGINAGLAPMSTNAETTGTTSVTAFNMDGVSIGTDTNTYTFNQSGNTYINWFLKRTIGVFEEICYIGTGSATTQAHNLGAVPELMIVKARDLTRSWQCYVAYIGNANALLLDSNGAVISAATDWNSTTPTASVITLGTSSSTNAGGTKYVAYIFASLAGISKVGSYTGNGGSQTINCGFAAGARLILIKRTDAAGDWFVWDTTRGIIAGNDPHLSLNTTDAEVTTDDSIDPDASGFIVNQLSATNINVNAATYIFLAIA